MISAFFARLVMVFKKPYFGTMKKPPKNHFCTNFQLLLTLPLPVEVIATFLPSAQAIFFFILLWKAGNASSKQRGLEKKEPDTQINFPHPLPLPHLIPSCYPQVHTVNWKRQIRGQVSLIR